MDELLRTVADAFAVRAAEKRLEFRCVLDPLLPGTVQGDALRLRQVLDNLVSNAFKFTVQGSVALEVRRTEAGEVRFEVTDTGIGIPANQCTAIFEPFRQVASPHRPDQSGGGKPSCAVERSTRLSPAAGAGNQRASESLVGRRHRPVAQPRADASCQRRVPRRLQP